MYCEIPMNHIGPLKLKGPEISAEVMVPLATFESPLWPSTNRGAKVSRLIGGVDVVILKDAMTRSIALEAHSALKAHEIQEEILREIDILKELVASTSRFARLQGCQTEILGSLLYLRFSITTGDASGHNMVTQAADVILKFLCEQYAGALRHISVSGNFCVDKKVSAVNGLLGRGKSVIAEGLISAEICDRVLKTTPEKIAELNVKKNWMGSVLAGSLRSANAHFANILLGFYLATGQDAANIVEGSQGMVVAEVRGGALYFAVMIPNIIVGTVGNGKGFPFVQENLRQMGCLEERAYGGNARRLAQILAATIWSGELSLLAAQTNPGELMRTHVAFERQS